MDLVPEGVIVALIAATPPTIAAFAALLRSASVEKQVKTGNGLTIGQLADIIHEDVKHNRDRLDAHIDNHDIHDYSN